MEYQMDNISEILPFRTSEITEKILKNYIFVKNTDSAHMIKDVNSGAMFILKTGFSNTSFDMTKSQKLIPFLNDLGIGEKVIQYWNERFPNEAAQGIGFSSNDVNVLWIIKHNTDKKTAFRNLLAHETQDTKLILLMVIQLNQVLDYILGSEMGKFFLEHNERFWLFTHWIIENLYVKENGTIFVKDFGLSSCWIDHRKQFDGYKYGRFTPNDHLPYIFSYAENEHLSHIKIEISILGSFLFVACGGKMSKDYQCDFSSIQVDDKVLGTIIKIVKKSNSGQYENPKEMKKDLKSALTILDKLTKTI